MYEEFISYVQNESFESMFLYTSYIHLKIFIHIEPTYKNIGSNLPEIYEQAKNSPQPHYWTNFKSNEPGI